MAITLNTKAYAFTNVLNGISSYLHRAAGVAAGFMSLTSRVSIDSANSRVSWKLKVPVVGTEATSCACPGDILRLSVADVNVKLAPGATVAERTDFALQLKDLVASPEFQASIINLQQPTA